MTRKFIAIALAAATLAATPAAARTPGPPAEVASAGPLALFYRIAWLLDFLGENGSDRACQHQANCA